MLLSEKDPNQALLNVIQYMTQVRGCVHIKSWGLHEKACVGPSQTTVDPAHVLEYMTRVIGDFLPAVSSLSMLLKILWKVGIGVFHGELLVIEGVTINHQKGLR